MLRLAGPLALLLLAACARLGPVDPPAPRTVRFGCRAGGPVVVTFDRDRARLAEADGRVVELDQRRSGSGFRYAGAAGELGGKGLEITWTAAGAAPRTCTAAALPAAVPTATLDGTRWRLESIRSSDDAQGTVRPPDPSRYTLEFRGDRAAFQLDCNRASATFCTTPEGSLTFGPAAMTRAACPAGSLDTRIAADLPRVRGYVLGGDTLSLSLEADGGVYIWRRAS